MEPRETILLVKVTAAKTTAVRATEMGSMRTAAPAEVSTPLPPLKWK